LTKKAFWLTLWPKRVRSIAASGGIKLNMSDIKRGERFFCKAGSIGLLALLLLFGLGESHGAEFQPGSGVCWPEDGEF
jgi:hypothetical protein